MYNRKIVIIDANNKQRNILRNLLLSESLEVLDFVNSMSAILWVKNNGSPAGVLLEEQAKPLNAEKTIAYLRDELHTTCPVLILTENKEPLHGFENVITKPYNKGTAGEVKKILCESNQNLEKSVNPKRFSLNYLEDIYEGNYELIIESLKIFTTSVEDKLVEIHILMNQKNYEGIRGVAHNIKPSFEMINNKKGKELCRKMVYESEPEELPGLVAALSEEYRQIKDELAEYIS